MRRLASTGLLARGPAAATLAATPSPGACGAACLRGWLAVFGSTAQDQARAQREVLPCRVGQGQGQQQGENRRLA